MARQKMTLEEKQVAFTKRAQREQGKDAAIFDSVAKDNPYLTGGMSAHDMPLYERAQMGRRVLSFVNLLMEAYADGYEAHKASQ